MIANHDIEKIVVVNKEYAEIYLNKKCSGIRKIS